MGLGVREAKMPKAHATLKDARERLKIDGFVTGPGGPFCDKGL